MQTLREMQIEAAPTNPSTDVTFTEGGTIMDDLPTGNSDEISSGLSEQTLEGVKLSPIVVQTFIER